MTSRHNLINHWLTVVFLISICFMPSAHAATVDKHGGTFIIATSEEPASLNPYMAFGSTDSTVHANTFDLLLYTNLEGEIIPGLAESWKISEDGLTYTFNLSKNAQWHDGKPFTSADVVFTFKELVGLHPKAAWWQGLKNSTSLQAPDEHTVVFKLQKPFPPFLAMIDYESGGVFMMPKHLFEGTDIKKNPYSTKPVGTGPFMFKEWVKGQHIEYVRNPTYYARGKEGKPFIDRLIFKFIPDSAGRIMALKKGEVDFVGSSFIDLEDVADLRKDPKITVDDRGEITGLKFLIFNLRHPMLAKKAVRQAMAYGIDKQKLVNFALAGEVPVAKSFIPSTMSWAYNPKVAEYSYNPQKANELLDKAGVAKGTNGIRFKLRLNMSGRGSDAAIVEIIRDDLRKIGIDVQIIPSDLATFYDTVFDRWDFDLVIQQMSIGSDPSMGVNRFLHSMYIKKGRSLNVEGYSNPEVDKLIDAEGNQADPKKRSAMWHRIQEIVMDELPLIPIHPLPHLNCYRSVWADVIMKAAANNHSRESAYLKK